MTETYKPKWRNGAGIAFILLLIVGWSVLAVTLGPYVTNLHWTVELLFYVVLGVGWIFPVRPLLTWMETGRWRRAPRA